MTQNSSSETTTKEMVIIKVAQGFNGQMAMGLAMDGETESKGERKCGTKDCSLPGQRALPPPAGHTLLRPSVLAKRKVPFQAESGDFPGVRASDPLAYDASM